MEAQSILHSETPTRRSAVNAALALVFILFGSAAWGQATVTAVPVQTLDLSVIVPPSPDPAGIVHLGDAGSLLVADSEVNETPIFQGVNLWELTTTGTVLGTAATTLYSNEPTGLAFDPLTLHLFVVDDNKEDVFEVDPGVDLMFGTADDVVTAFDTLVFGSDDPEGITFDTQTGHLFIAEGENATIFEVDPGANGLFDGIAPDGDDIVTSFDVAASGASDPEGIAFDETTGTLLVADRSSKSVFEFSKAGVHLRTIDLGLGSGVRISGIAIGPASDNPVRRDLYITDRGVDNGANPNENDGLLYEFAVTPLAGNAAPVVSAGTTQTVRGAFPQAALDGAVADDGHPAPPSSLAVAWSQQDGPGVATFVDPSDTKTVVSFSAAGTYTLGLSADDGELQTTDEVVVRVNPPRAGCGLGPELAPILVVLGIARRRQRASREAEGPLLRR